MVSQLKNTGLGFSYYPSESFSAPYFLDYQYPLTAGLNHAGNQQNQLGHPISQVADEKKPKKLKKKAGTEKNSKDHLSSEELCRESLIAWLDFR